jgi:hypothetical protein
VLALVRGCEQMTLRVYAGGRLPRPVAEAASRRSPGADRPRGGPGSRYLERRARAIELPELAPLRDALAGLVRVERAEPAGLDEPAPRGDAAGGRLVARVYHLVARGRAAAYTAAVAAAAPALPRRVVVIGPSPAYAFAAGPA